MFQSSGRHFAARVLLEHSLPICQMFARSAPVKRKGLVDFEATWESPTKIDNWFLNFHLEKLVRGAPQWRTPGVRLRLEQSRDRWSTCTSWSLVLGDLLLMKQKKISFQKLTPRKPLVNALASCFDGHTSVLFISISQYMYDFSPSSLVVVWT